MPRETPFALGTRLLAERNFARAAEAFERAAEVESKSADAFFGLATALGEMGDFGGASEASRKAADLRPQWVAAHRTHGAALVKLERYDDAATAFRRALALDPLSEDLKYALASVSGGHGVLRTPEAYVRTLFDNYAPRYDAHLTEDLRYRGHEYLRDAVLEVAPGRMLDILDLGCGTGLCGAELQATARTLVGVDLSPAMVVLARARGIYQQVIQGDVLAALDAETRTFDLVLAGDVFVYLGDLSAAFAGAARVLRPGGWLAFTVEQYAGEGFALCPTRRFAHALGYLRTLAAANSMREVYLKDRVLRSELNKGVAGWVAVYQAPEAGDTAKGRLR